MGLELAKAFVTILPDASRFGSGVAAAQSGIVRSVSGMQGALSVATGSLIASGISAVVGGAINYVNDSVSEAAEGIASSARLAAVLKATGNAAGFSAGQLEEYAGSLQLTTTFGDETIKDSMSKLATFKKVQGDMFKRATQSALDMSAVGFGSAESAAVQLGKALENPIKGVSALTRSGITFTEAEKAKIKELVESNRLLEAQEVVMAAVEGQVKGVANALAQTPAGQMEVINNQFGELKEQLGGELLPLMVMMKQQTLEMSKAWIEWAITGIRAAQAIGANLQGAFDVAIASTELQMSRLLDKLEDWGVSLDFMFKKPEIVGLSDKAAARVRAGELDHLGKDYTNKRKAGTPSELTKGAEERMKKALEPLVASFEEISRKAEEAKKAPTLPGGLTPQEEIADAASSGIKAGFMDLESFGRSIQESMLGQDKQDRMIGLMESGNKIQEGIRADLKNMTKGGTSTAVLGGGDA